MKRVVCLWFAFTISAWSQDQKALPTPVLEFTFNEPDKTAQSTGSLSSQIQFSGLTGDYLEVFGKPGEGVSGGANDSNIQSTPDKDGRGSFALGPKIDCLNDAKALTITFWIRLDSAKEGTACIFRQRAGGRPEGLIIVAEKDLGIACIINDVLVASRPFSYETSLSEWTFVAIVFDAIDLKKMTFYGGTVSSSVDEKSEANFGGEIKASDAASSLLAATDGTDSFPGKLDNFRVYDSALTESQVEAVRKLDITK